MDQKNTAESAAKIPQQDQPRQPNEQSRLNIDEFLRITDPNNQQVFVEQRG